MTEHDPAYDDEVALADQMIGNEIDPASQSLAGALRTSFRLLSVIMVFLLGAYILSGMETIDSGTRGVVLRFGRMVGAAEPIKGTVLDEGIHFTWPFPVDEVVVVSVQEQSMAIDSFWHYERPGQEALTEAEKSAVGDGLRPQYDGSLLTADQGLVHIKWGVTYQVGREDRHVLNYVANVGDQAGAERGLLRSLVENASVQAAAQYTAEEIVRGSREFTMTTQQWAQQMLNDLNTGLQITNITLAAHTPPLQTLAAFRAVTMAENERQQAIDTAEKEATAVLRDAAGENWQPLHEAIIAYDRSLSNEAEAPERYKAIVDLLHDDRTTGEARTVIAAARGAASATVSGAREAYEDYRKLLESFKTTPGFTVSRHWMDTQQAIMANEMNVKMYVPTGVKTILYMKHDPSVWRTIKLKQTKQTSEDINPYVP